MFERLFGPGDEDAPMRARFRELEKGVLDGVLEKSHRLSSTLAPSDRRKLDEYMTSIREVELRIQKTESISRGRELICRTPAANHAGLRRR